MKQISDQDWELLSGYSDGELNPLQTRRMTKRIRNEPVLAEALKKTRGLQSTLGDMRPVQLQTGSANSKRSCYRFAAVAASFTAVAAVSMHLILSNLHVHSPSDWHNALLKQSFDVNAGAETSPVLTKASADIPDLVAAGLWLVADMDEARQARVLHYSGRNNCRLTLAITLGEIPSIKAGADMRTVSWRIQTFNYTLMSSGMDATRFAAISHHVRLFTEQLNRPATVLAMRETTKKAVPCV